MALVTAINKFATLEEADASSEAAQDLCNVACRVSPSPSIIGKVFKQVVTEQGSNEEAFLRWESFLLVVGEESSSATAGWKALASKWLGKLDAQRAAAGLTGHPG